MRGVRLRRSFLSYTTSMHPRFRAQAFSPPYFRLTVFALFASFLHFLFFYSFGQFSHLILVDSFVLIGSFTGRQRSEGLDHGEFAPGGCSHLSGLVGKPKGQLTAAHCKSGYQLALVWLWGHLVCNSQLNFWMAGPETTYNLLHGSKFEEFLEFFCGQGAGCNFKMDQACKLKKLIQPDENDEHFQKFRPWMDVIASMLQRWPTVCWPYGVQTNPGPHLAFLFGKEVSENAFCSHFASFLATCFGQHSRKPARISEAIQKFRR